VSKGYDLTDRCVVCNRKFGAHSNIGNHCPDEVGGFFKATTFVPPAKAGVDAATPYRQQVQIAPTPTLRDQFAMAALTGLWANMQSDADFADTTCDDDAETCYMMADAMLAARAPGGGE
jgi:hypothetical protein